MKVWRTAIPRPFSELEVNLNLLQRTPGIEIKTVLPVKEEFVIIYTEEDIVDE